MKSLFVEQDHNPIFKQISIKQKILLIIGTSITLTAIIAFQGVRSIDNLRIQLEDVVTAASERVSLTHQLRTKLLEMQRSEKNLIAVLNLQEMQEYQLVFEQHTQSFEEGIEQLQQVIRDTHQAKLLQIKNLFEQYQNVVMHIFELSLNASNQKAIELSVHQGREVIDQMEVILKEISKVNELEVQASVQESQQIYWTSRNTMFVASMINIIVVALIGWLTLQNITQRIKKMVGFAKAIADGDHNAVIEDDGTDELHTLSHALNQMIETLNHFTLQLEQSNQYKSEFLANVSHELRTPLNSLIVLSQSLIENEDQNLTTEQLSFLKTIYGGACELLEMINDILDLAKVEAGKIVLYPEKVKIHDIQSYIEKHFTPLVKERGLDFKVETVGLVPETIVTDQQRVEQILKNFLSNAIKFTNSGHVTFQTYVPSAQELKSHHLAFDSSVAFAVLDTGIGIPESHQRQVFEAFHQVDGSNRRRYGGTGLGLSISLKFSQVLGGHIHVHSKEGSGSTFTLYLPNNKELLTPVQVQLTNPQPNSSLTYDRQEFDLDTIQQEMSEKEGIFEKLEGTKLLLVDDDMRNIFSLVNVLRKKGIDVLVESNGKSALATLKQHSDIQLVLIDLLMPEMDGYQLTQKIRSIDGLSHLPLIILSAETVEGTREKCLSLGADEYLAKPLNTHRLLSLIYEHTHRNQ